MRLRGCPTRCAAMTALACPIHGAGMQGGLGVADFRYFKVSSRFWTDEKVAQWDDDTRLLALYLLTCPHRSMEGLYRLPKAYICADLGWDAKRLAKPFSKLLEDGFISYDETVHVVLVRHALKYQAPDNPNQGKAAIKALEELPETPLLWELQRLAERFAKPFAEQLRERFGEPPAPTPTPAPTPSPDKQTRAADAAPAKAPRAPEGSYPVDVEPAEQGGYTEAFERFWRVYPRRVGKKAAFKAWNRLLKRSRDNPNPPTEEQLIAAARNYNRAMQMQGRPLDRIKHPSTFLSARDRWWEEWVNGIPDGELTSRQRRLSAVDLMLQEEGIFRDAG